jgi:hypothetical protein
MFGLTGIWRYVVPGVIALALIAAIVLGVKSCKEIDQENNNQLVNYGEVLSTSQSQGETINAVQNANDARTNPTSNELNVVCERYDRNCHTPGA